MKVKQDIESLYVVTPLHKAGTKSLFELGAVADIYILETRCSIHCLGLRYGYT